MINDAISRGVGVALLVACAIGAVAGFIAFQIDVGVMRPYLREQLKSSEEVGGTDGGKQFM
jgi:hypothetical protein